MGNSKIEIAKVEDAEQLAVLVNNAYRGDSAKEGWTHEADLLGGIRINEKGICEIINNPNSAILKYGDEKIIGCVQVEKKENKLYIGMLTVSPSVQSNGIGKQLLAAAENYAKLGGCTETIMTVISERKELIDWYQRRGYTDTGRKEPFPDDPDFGIPKKRLEFIVMTKEIGIN